MRVRGSRGLWLTSLVLIALGILLLLNNFLFLGGFNLASLAPLVLVVLGALILLRGDIVPGREARSFGITRGSVQSATLEISSGLIDVSARALGREGRLIAGQYAFDSRPGLEVQNAHAHLRLDRAATPFWSFANWDVGLARDLPWGLYVSTHLGQIDLDLSGLTMQRAIFATGIGDIRVVCPSVAAEPLFIRSALGHIRVLTPTGVATRIRVDGSRLMRLHVDEARYEFGEDETYYSRDAAPDAPIVEVVVQGTYGDAYLA